MSDGFVCHFVAAASSVYFEFDCLILPELSEKKLTAAGHSALFSSDGIALTGCLDLIRYLLFEKSTDYVLKLAVTCVKIFVY